MADARCTSTDDSLRLDAACRLVSAARDRVRSKDLPTAKAALDAAEDNVAFAGVFKKDPLSEANEALLHALHNHKRGATHATKASLHRAIGRLDYATNEVDETNRLLVPRSLNQAAKFDGEISTDPSNTERGLADLHLRTRALCEQSIESFAMTFDRIHLGNGFKADPIEAKLHLAFAEADRLTIGGDGAGAQVEGVVRSRISSLHEALRQLAEPARFARLRRELCIFIRT